MADVIVHDRLGCEEILASQQIDAEIIDVGKIPGKTGRSQGEINELILREAKAGQRVVRLKGGDPFIFGRGLEEILFLRKHGVRCHVTPGISSASAAPMMAGAPLTHRDASRAFTVSTGRDRNGNLPKVNPNDTNVFLMSFGSIARIVEEMILNGVSSDTAAMMVCNATTYREKTVIATLGTIEREIKKAELSPPGVLVIGETVRFAERRSQFIVLVTSTGIPCILKRNYPTARILHRPVVRMEGIRGIGESHLDALCNSDWILFNNRHSVVYTLEALIASSLDTRRLRGKIAAVGEETVDALRDHSLVADLMLVDGRRDILAERFAGAASGQTVVFPCEESYAGGLVAKLRSCGIDTLHLLPVYRRLENKPSSIDWKAIDSVFFASPGGVQSFEHLYPEAPLAKLRAVCIGESSIQRAAEIGFGQMEDLTAESESLSDIEEISG